MDDCIFCKIVKGDAPATKVYEDADLIAIMNIYPAVKGHVLVIPKEHLRWMNDATDKTIASSFILTKDLMNTIKSGLSCDYVQLAVVGEEVPHFHIHLIPRMYGDEHVKLGPSVTYASSEEMAEYAQKIKI